MTDPASTTSANGFDDGRPRDANAAEAALLRWVDRVDSLVAAETRALLKGEKIDFENYNSKKSHALLEFIAVSRTVTGESPQVEQALRRLSERLAQNSQALRQNLLAASEISALLIKAIRSEESDGTYSRYGSAASQERRP